MSTIVNHRSTIDGFNHQDGNDMMVLYPIGPIMATTATIDRSTLSKSSYIPGRLEMSDTNNGSIGAIFDTNLIRQQTPPPPRASSALSKYGPNSSWHTKMHIIETCKEMLSSRVCLVSCLIPTLVCFVLLNTILTLWIMFSLNLHQNGLPLKFNDRYRSKLAAISAEYVDLVIDGQLTVNNSLVVNSIESIPLSNSLPSTNVNRNLDVSNNGAGPLVISADHLPTNHIQLKHINAMNGEENSISISQSNIELKTSNFIIESHDTSAHRSTRTSSQSVRITPDQLSIDADIGSLKSTPGGIRVTQLNTSSIQSDLYNNLRIESRTDSLLLQTPKQVQLESMSGSVVVNGHNQIVLNGSVHLDATSVIMTHLARQSRHRDRSIARHQHRFNPSTMTDDPPLAYQVCMCSDGNLFVADSKSVCEAHIMICG